MSAINKISIAVLVLAFLSLGGRGLLIKIEPGSVGIVNREWTTGFADEDFAPGYHLDIGPLHTWTVFDTTVQTLHMRQRPGPGEEMPLMVRSVDGASVTMDLSIKYRISEGAAWQVMKIAGAGQAYNSGYKVLARDRSIRVLQKSLGSITTEQFYDPAGRAEAQRIMERDLTVSLAELHLDLVAILIRDIRFQEAFEEGIKNKALAQEGRLLNQAETLAADYRGRTAKIERETLVKVLVIDEERSKQLATMTAENDRMVAVIRADFEKRVTELRSDADLYAARRAAEGTFLLKEAEAKGQALKRSALSSAGGTVLVALEIATNLNLGSMLISTQQMNPLDINGILESLGVDR
jgi:regulator of protease activity HflC (stomatin/prohibitin superfamily)